MWTSTIPGVNDVQADGSFPSGHTAFFVLITSVAFREPDLFALHVRVLFAVLSGLTAVERIKTGAHFVTDVLVGAAFAFLFVQVFYELDGHTVISYKLFPQDLDFQLRNTFIIASAQLLTVYFVGILREESTPLTRNTFLHNNLARLEDEPEDTTTPPLSPSKDFLAPYIGISAVAFWITPVLIRERLLPLPGTVSPWSRLLGALSAAAFITIVVLPVRKVLERKLQHNHSIRFMFLIAVYMAMLTFTLAFSHALIHGIDVLSN